MKLWRMAKEIIQTHGGLRKAARALKMDAACLHRLSVGLKENPSSETLRKLGIRRERRVEYFWTNP